MVRSCTEPGCDYVTDRGYNLRRHEEKVHQKPPHPDADFYEDDLFQSSSDEDERISNAQRSSMMQSTVTRVKREQPDSVIRSYQEAGDWIFGLGPAATTATLVHELMSEFSFSHDIAEAIAVSSRVLATGVASLCREVDTMTRSQKGSGYARRMRAAIESWSRQPDWMNEMEGDRDVMNLEFKESQIRGKKRSNAEFDQSSGSDKGEESVMETGEKQEGHELQQETDVEEINVVQSQTYSENKMDTTQPQMPETGISPTVSPMLSAAVELTASPLASSVQNKTPEHTVDVVDVASSPEMPILAKESVVAGPALDRNNNTSAVVAQVPAMFDFRRMPGFSDFVEQMQASFMAQVSGFKKKSKKKKARRSSEQTETDSSTVSKAQCLASETAAVPKPNVVTPAVEMADLHQPGAMEERDWSPASNKSITGARAGMQTPAASGISVTTDTPTSRISMSATAKMPGPQPAYDRSAGAQAAVAIPCRYERIPGLFVYMAKCRNIWQIEVADSTEVLVIGDSNTKNANDIPEGWEVHSLSGGRMEDVNALLKKMVGGRKLEVLIVQVGVNHRDTGFPHEDVKVLKLIAEQMKLRLLVQGISISSRLPESTQRKLIEFNEMLHKSFGAHYIFPQRDRKVGLDPTDTSYIHYDVSTMQRQLDNMVNRLRDLTTARASASSAQRPMITLGRPCTSGDGSARY